jgi:hypothetical protein
MNKDQIILAILFVVSSTLTVIGNNILLRLVQKSCPDKSQFRLSPSGRILRRLRTEKATDINLIKKLDLGLTLERIGWFGYGLVGLMFLYKWLER